MNRSKVMKFIILFICLAQFSCSKTHVAKNTQVFFRYPPPLVVIDAGHGGKDRGASSNNKKYHEKHFTLKLAWMVKKALDERGYRTIMTRKKDYYLSLKQRVDIAKNASCFLSIHFNAAKNKDAEGIEVFHSDEKLKKNILAQNLAKHILEHSCKTSKAPSRGVKTANFYVIKNNNIAAVLIEGGFLTNTSEMNRIQNPSYLYRLAHGIANGVDHYFIEQKNKRLSKLQKP